MVLVGSGGVATWLVEGGSERGYRGVDDFLGLFIELSQNGSR